MFPVSWDAHQVQNGFVLFRDPVNDPAVSGPPVDAHQLQNGFVLLQDPVNGPAVSGPPVDAHQVQNGFVLFQDPVNDPAVSGPPVDAHQLQNGFVLDQGPVNDPAVSGPPVDAHQLQNGFVLFQDPVNDPSDGHHDIPGTEIASSDGADTFVWSDTFRQGDGANHVSADEEHWPQMDAFSEASLLDGGTDLHRDENMPDTTNNSIISAAVVDHWFV